MLVIGRCVSPPGGGHLRDLWVYRELLCFPTNESSKNKGYLSR